MEELKDKQDKDEQDKDKQDTTVVEHLVYLMLMVATMVVI